MAFLNLSYNLLIFEDDSNIKNPNIRLPDISKDIQQIPVDFDKSARSVIGTGDTETILTSQRGVLRVAGCVTYTSTATSGT